MLNTRTLARALAKQTERVLSQEEHLRRAMKEIEEAAYSGGLMSEATHLDRNSSEEFSQQLWVENPEAHDWLNAKREAVKNPLLIREMADLFDVLGA